MSAIRAYGLTLDYLGNVLIRKKIGRLRNPYSMIQERIYH